MQNRSKSLYRPRVRKRVTGTIPYRGENPSVERNKRPAKRTIRQRRVIINFDDLTHTLLQATASLAGFESPEDYAREAVLQRLEVDREACRSAITRAAVRKSRDAPTDKNSQLTFSES